MHLALLHDGRPALLRVEGPAGAPAVLFFHPFPLNADIWDEMLRSCAAAGLCAAAIDAPGFGGSPPLGQPLTMESIARLGAAALDTLGIERASVAGCSMGGYATMAFVRLFPQRVNRVALIATKASADTDEAKKNRERQAQLALTQGAAAVLPELTGKLLSQSPSPEARRRVDEVCSRATAQGIADALRGMAQRRNSVPDLAGWKAPTLVIAGEHDQLMPRSELELLGQRIPGARYEVIASAGHLPFVEKPREVAQLLTGHLQVRGA